MAFDYLVEFEDWKVDFDHNWSSGHPVCLEVWARLTAAGVDFGLEQDHLTKASVVAVAVEVVVLTVAVVDILVQMEEMASGEDD